jgi:hemolysin III
MNQTPHTLDDILSTWTHGIGAALSAIGTVALVVGASDLGDGWKVVSFSIFGASLVMLYLASTLYHNSQDPRLRSIYKMIDHCAIFCLIAGTYTPFLLVNLRDSVGWTLFAVIWGLAFTGVMLKLKFGNRYKLARVGIYLVMGWLILFASTALTESLSELAWTLTLMGGIAYTAGVVFYLFQRLPLNHSIWHLFVMAGSASHFFAVYYGVLPFGVTPQ